MFGNEHSLDCRPQVIENLTLRQQLVRNGRRPRPRLDEEQLLLSRYSLFNLADRNGPRYLPTDSVISPTTCGALAFLGSLIRCSRMAIIRAPKFNPLTVLAQQLSADGADEDSIGGDP